MRTPLKPALALTVALVAATSGSAFAQTSSTGDASYHEQKTKDGASVVFKDEPMTADARGALGATIVPPRGAARMGLIRPRLQFVTEMLKSVENL